VEAQWLDEADPPELLDFIGGGEGGSDDGAAIGVSLVGFGDPLETKATVGAGGCELLVVGVIVVGSECYSYHFIAVFSWTP
jgi:hypothetical protein